MIKLKNIVEVIGKDKGSDSLPNSRAKEFMGALTSLKSDIVSIERMIKNYKGGAPRKRKGDINYKMWSDYGFLTLIKDLLAEEFKKWADEDNWMQAELPFVDGVGIDGSFAGIPCPYVKMSNKKVPGVTPTIVIDTSTIAMHIGNLFIDT